MVLPLVMVGITEASTTRSPATPRTFARFTGRPDGRVGGLPQTREWANFRALSHRSGQPGLYLVGDTVFPGAGTIGVTLSGLNAYREVRAADAAYERCVAERSESDAECRALRERRIQAEQRYGESARQGWGCDPAQEPCPTPR